MTKRGVTERAARPPRIRRQMELGLKLNLWYSACFTLGALGLFTLSYLLLVHVLVQNDRDEVRATLEKYRNWYQEGGRDALAQHFESEDTLEKASTYVELTGKNEEVYFYHFPQQEALSTDEQEMIKQIKASKLANEPIWVTFPALGQNKVWNIASTTVDGFGLEVGRTAENRELLLGRFRIIFLITLIPVVLVNFAVGALITYTALAPVRGIISAVQIILDTGNRTARVQRPYTEDELDELVTLFNEMLDRNEKLIQAMRDALDHMAHDMRTPLTRLRGEAELALHRNDPEQMQDALYDAIEESDRLSNMLKTIMDISEAESGATRLDMTNFPLAPLVQSLFDLYEGVADDRGIRLEMRVDPKGVIFADRNRLQMVLSNLLDNAIKYTPPETKGRVVVFAEFLPKGVRIGVKDSGQGISQEDMPRIWERLYRSDQSRSEKGLGLGLSLVRALVEAQGGKTYAESFPGKGSVFYVTIPKKPDFPQKAKTRVVR